MFLAHFVPQFAAQRDGRFEGGQALGMHRRAIERHAHHADAQPFMGRVDFLGERAQAGRRRVGSARIGGAGGVEQGGAVAHRDRTAMIGRQPGHAFAQARPHRVASAGRLEAEHAAAGGGNADRTAGIAGMGEGHQPRRHRRRRTTAGASG
ncbi:hypothetical protein D9M70_252830 [compost metagenome]